MRLERLLIGAAAITLVGWPAARWCWTSPALAEPGLVVVHSGQPWENAKKLSGEALEPRFESIKSLYELKRAPGANDWLLAQREPPQTFADLIHEAPSRPAGKLKTIVIQPLGELGPGQQRVVTLVADYMARFFGLPVRVEKLIPASAIPDTARRLHPTYGVPQLSTTGAVKVLTPKRPADAFAYVAFTGEDLFPRKDWNFVFGQAFPEERIGLWSLARYGNPDASPEAFRLCLSRAMKVAVHEMTHLLGVNHCQAYECVMNGSNSLTETDSGSHFLCPICLQKLVWSTHVDPVIRMRRLQEFYTANGFDKEAGFAARNLKMWAEAGAR